MENAKRNGTIDFFKFIAAVMIAAYHVARGGVFSENAGFHFFYRGYIGVEFYFIVSGYLLAAKAANYGGGSVLNANLRMIRKKFLRIFAYLYPAVLVANAIRIMMDYSPHTLAHNLLYSVPELLNLQMLGFPTFVSIYISWFLSALMFASFLIYPLLCKCRELLSKYIAPLFSVALYGFIMQQNGGLGNPGKWYGITFSGMLLGVAGIFWGAAYELKLHFDRLEDEDRPLLGTFEIFGYVCFLYYGIFVSIENSADFLLLLPLLLSVSISFSNKSVLNKRFSHPAFSFMGALSFSIYLSHGAVMLFLRDLSLGWFPLRLYALYFAIVFSLSLFNFWVGGKLLKEVKTVRKALALIFLLMVAAEVLRIMCNSLGV